MKQYAVIGVCFIAGLITSSTSDCSEKPFEGDKSEAFLSMHLWALHASRGICAYCKAFSNILPPNPRNFLHVSLSFVALSPWK